ncbi:TetR/AcrR family transcriptional regulator [Rhodococcus sp. NPDC057014]|uniref:TetR/AcrR family transcriptional regulator n=1 Tax=Rhodococcus sp. NPDC057014 TaxID=3346000 RepID=UPI003642897F
MKQARGRRGPTDRERPARLAQAALSVATERGLGELSHRAVAERASVPLGSTTYHYTDRHDLLAAGMREAVIECRVAVDDWSRTLNRDNVIRKLAEWIHSQVAPGMARDRLLLWFEFSVMAVRFDDLKLVNHDWDSILPDALRPHVGPELADECNVATNGLLFNILMHDLSPSRSEIEDRLTKWLVRD